MKTRGKTKRYSINYETVYGIEKRKRVRKQREGCPFILRLAFNDEKDKLPVNCPFHK